MPEREQPAGHFLYLRAAEEKPGPPRRGGEKGTAMFRSLHMKLVLIMLLLITSLMTVVGTFMMTSITSFYIDEFYQQVDSVFGSSNPANAAFVNSCQIPQKMESEP